MFGRTLISISESYDPADKKVSLVIKERVKLRIQTALQ